jgi:hypothetical protein
MKRVVPLLLLLVLTGCPLLDIIVRPLPDVKTPVRQQLKPGQQTIVNLVIAPPQNGASISLSVENPAPDILDVSLVEKSVTISVHASALPQGLIPVGVVVSAGSEQVRVRIPVEIGDGITREFARFNAIRAQANLNPVIFNETDSMNCWLHGRYSVVNNRLEHTEDLSLPYATPEGKQCAGSSNIAESYQAIPELANVTPMSDILFGVPFHALGMIRENQQTVGIGYFSSFDSKYPSLAILGGGITSRGDGNAAQGTVTFPGNESTTDFFQYYGGEWPNPLTSCPNFDPKTTGLPIVIRSPNAMNTTVSNAQLSVDGQPLELCAFGSTQYSNSTDQPINYPDGPHSAEQIARDLLKGYGAAVLLPKAPFLPNKTYLVSLQLNGQPMSWRFHTASTPRTPRWKEKPFGRSISR